MNPRMTPPSPWCVLQMPMVPHAVYAMLAAARIGAIHSVVFAGFSAEALAQRMTDANSRFLLTADQGLRGGKAIDLKEIVDQGLSKMPADAVDSVLIYPRTGSPRTKMKEGRDSCMLTAMEAEKPVCPATTMASEVSAQGDNTLCVSKFLCTAALRRIAATYPFGGSALGLNNAVSLTLTITLNQMRH